MVLLLLDCHPFRRDFHLSSDLLLINDRWIHANICVAVAVAVVVDVVLVVAAAAADPYCLPMITGFLFGLKSLKKKHDTE